MATLVEAPTPTKTATCPVCKGEGLERINPTRNLDGVWDCDERTCGPCAGTGDLPALEHYTTSVLRPSGRVQWRCRGCSCHVVPTRHLPFSEDCRAAAEERAISRADDDPWGTE